MKLARILSYLLHPLIMPLLGTFLMFIAVHWLMLMPIGARRYVFLVVIGTTIILPLLVMPLLKSRKIIASYELNDPRERRIPLLAAAFSYMIGAFILHKVNAPIIFSIFLNASSLSILLSAMITLQWKISNHMTAIGGITGMILAVSVRWMADTRWLLIMLFILAGWIAWSRLRLNTHRPFEVYVGYVLGFAVNFLLMRFI